MLASQLRRVISQNSELSKGFRGVLAKDEVTAEAAGGGTYILNSEVKGRAGAHWYLVQVAAGRIYFFDSLAIDPIDPMILSWFQNISGLSPPPVIANKIAYQSPHSTLCSFYVLQVLSLLNKGFTFWDSLQNFSATDQRKNDIIVLEYARSVLHLDPWELLMPLGSL